MKPSFFLLAVICFVSLHSWGQKCLPVKSIANIISSDIPGHVSKEPKQLINTMYYDTQGRLVIDSVSTNDYLSSFIYNTEHYSYSHDSIFSINSKGHTIFIRTNSEGWPLETVFTEAKSSFRYTAAYNNDGTLQQLIQFSDSTNYEIIDSIVYENYNIVSYRLTYANAEHKPVSDKISYTYYMDYLYPQNFKATDRMFALCNHLAGGTINIQAFSNNLLATETHEVKCLSKSYTYSFDAKGNVTGKDTSRSDDYFNGIIQKAKFEYSCN